MKKHVLDFVQRGLLAAVFGPVVLAVIYGILGATGVVASLTPGEVCKGILTISLMAFVAAGITMVYTVESLPLISAILIHAGVLYLDYLMIYFVNDWMPRNFTAVGVFTVIFVVGFSAIWIGIYVHTKSKTDQLNQELQAKSGRCSHPSSQ